MRDCSADEAVSATPAVGRRDRNAWLIALAMTLVAAAAVPLPVRAAQDLTGSDDAQVLERLPARVRVRVTTPQDAAQTARRWIDEARQLAEPRYLGRAQAALAVWWSRPDAPIDLAVLQATIEQSRHEFAAARATLERALKRDPSSAQGWLTLATIDRLEARYADALAACEQVRAGGAPLHAAACRLETRSLLGHHDEARSGLRALLRQTGSDTGVRAWLLSLAGENEERAGRDSAALADYRASLALSADDYTALALADLLLRTLDDPAGAVAALAGRPASDAIELRRAAALKRQDDAAWHALADDLGQRFAALAERGDDPALHAREAALHALWIEPDAARAWAAAEANLRLQREPFDWWLAFRSAEAAGRQHDIERLAQAVRATGLVDARLARWLPAAP